MRLMDQVRAVLRRMQYSPITEETYVRWILRYIRFHGVRHPATMGRDEVRGFLEHLAVTLTVASATQNQALSALLFLYREVLGMDIGGGQGLFARKAHTLPVVLTRNEARAVIEGLRGSYGLMGRLIYGSGLQLSECIGLRVRDVDLVEHQILVRDARGQVHHATVLPESVAGKLMVQVEEVARTHGEDLRAGFGTASLPAGFGSRARVAERELGWQWLFPASRISTDPASGVRRRFHIDPSAVQKAMRKAASNANLTKRASCQTLRHSFAVHLLEAGANVRTVQTLLGHGKVDTTMVYMKLVDAGALSPRSPLDSLPVGCLEARRLPL